MTKRSANEILDREYLEMRAKVLELAASLDRMDRGQGSADQRVEKIHQGLAILQDDQPDKAKRVQILFSRDYDESWRSEFGI